MAYKGVLIVCVGAAAIGVLAETLRWSWWQSAMLTGAIILIAIGVKYQ